MYTELNIRSRKFSRLSAKYSTLGNQSLRFIQLRLLKIRTTAILKYAGAKIEPLAKRALDLSIVIVALISMLPLLLITAIAIKLDSSGPVFFSQKRVGLRGKLFTCYKFRSMSTDAELRKAELMAHNEADGPVFKMQNDPRVTRVGAIIRKLSIDELPQLLNVLKGEMSIVGPRPALPQEVAQYTSYQRQRLNVIPGLTGLQQVSGRSNLDFENWIRLDLEYVDKQSIGYDILILCKTIPAIVLSRGAY